MYMEYFSRTRLGMILAHGKSNLELVHTHTQLKQKDLDIIGLSSLPSVLLIGLAGNFLYRIDPRLFISSAKEFHVYTLLRKSVRERKRFVLSSERV